MEFRKQTLDNGLQIVAECNPQAYSTALGFFVKTGSRDETDAISGVSHFLEHMAFKGTPTRSADDVNHQFDEIGAHYNAFTNEENTVYHAAVLPEYQDRAVELLADILRPSLRDEDFQTEKQVIIEEIHMYEDQPPFGADEKSKAAFFGDHPLGRSVLGTEESITDLTPAAMRAYFDHRYSPGNIAIAAAGRIDFDSLRAVAEKFCGHWQPVQDGRIAERPVPQHGFQVICKEIATQQYVLELADGPAARNIDRLAAKLLTTVLGDDSGSRLYWELVDPGLAEHAVLNHYEYDGAGLMMTYLSCEPGDVAENLQRVFDIYRQAEADGVTAEELAQAKSKVRSRIVLSGERPRGRLFSVGSDWVYREEYRTVEEDLVDMAGITLDQVNALLAKYPLSQNSTVTIGPLEDVRAPK